MQDRNQPQAPPTSDLCIEAATGIVRRNGQSVRLSCREREIVTALAVAERPLSAGQLGALLSPDTCHGEGANLAKVYVHRLRRRTSPAMVVSSDGGYEIAPDVEIDAVEARRVLAALVREAHLKNDDIARLLVHARSLRSEPPIAMSEREWFRTIGPSLRRLGRELAIALGRKALDRGAVADALCIARELTYEEPSDEEAWELLIRAHLCAGEDAAALEGYRFYERILALDLQCAPSAGVRALILERQRISYPAVPRRSQNELRIERAASA